ncbi:MAG: heme-binding protein [Akkermansiaceae bacterium]|nr:heme-binding protein [Akkermansiaceae bacterium]MCP5545714.1 heme-binding protein [Akkermansiaceae bacterium]MCP5546699.1 heme-binding protein [Akkermansiaceae bacterium]
MKKKFYPLFALLTSFPLVSCAEPPNDGKPAYVSEAPLPKGWPEPGPFNEVRKKTYPAYRAAFTNGKGENSAFWTLFKHIKRNSIPMTAPVEMKMREDDQGLEQNSMAFLYQNGNVGSPGKDGTKVEVRDVPAATVLSYAWQGPDSKANISAAKTALEDALEKQGLEETGFRLLGYNGPGTPRAKKTWEPQALLE